MPSMLSPLLMPGGRRARHQVLIFHRVVDAHDPMLPGEPDLAWFDWLIGALKRYFRVLPLSEAVGLARVNALPAASISISFDDGYADNFNNALPVLERHGVPATFFVATDYLDGGRMWNDTIVETARRLPLGDPARSLFPQEAMPIGDDDDRRRLAEQVINGCKFLPAAAREAQARRFASLQDAPLPDGLMMTSDQLSRMAASECAEIGAHTCSHPILANCDVASARYEIERGAARLQELTGTRPRLFAYPNGKLGRDYLPEQVALVREAGFEAAVTTDWGTLGRETDRFQIPRFTPWRRGRAQFMLGLLRARYGMS